MKIRLLLVVFTALLSIQSHSQNESAKPAWDDEVRHSISIKVDEEGKYYSRSIQTAFSKAFSDVLDVENNAPFTLFLKAQFSEPRTIEGMESRTYINGVFIMTLSNLLTGNTIWSETFKTSGKGMNARTAATDAIETLASQPKLRDQLITHLAEAYESHFQSHCYSTLHLLPETGSWEDLNLTYYTLQYFVGSLCESEAWSKLSRVEASLDQLSCDKMVHELTIRIESGQFNPSRVVQQLLAISPDAPCADEAVDLARKVGNVKGKIDEVDREVLNQYIQIVLSNEAPTRRQNYHRLRWNY